MKPPTLERSQDLAVVDERLRDWSQQRGGEERSWPVLMEEHAAPRGLSRCLSALDDDCLCRGGSGDEGLALGLQRLVPLACGLLPRLCLA